tara:strand:- start:101 stop:538 length:438 start_codon:yes stop_codon:yes gene_type:complete
MSLVSKIDISKNILKNDEIMENENIILQILAKSGFVLTQNISELNGIMIPRDLLINDEKYNIVKEYLEKLKKHKLFSSTFLTSLHKDAEKKQKWPLLNLVRQILKVNSYRMKPIRKSAGKTKLGKKKYIRFFLIDKLKKTEELEL